MRVNHRQRTHIFMLAGVFALMAVTLYMAFGFPSALLQLKQSDTTELKAVILIGLHGEVTPPRDAYFEAYGEEPPEQWFTLGGPNQLTNMGKERMYLLGKFLKLRYHDKLLHGNPRRLLVRSENSDKCLESAQALIAGLNPPTGNWFWSASGGGNVRSFTSSLSSAPQSDPEMLAHLWQPKAVHTTSEQLDDLLSSRTKCLLMDSLQAHWKNSTRYAHLLNEFRHDLQILRQNTGLEFEDDLEMLANVEDQLRARNSLAMETGGSATQPPSWYTSTFASRLAHVADATAGCRFSQTGTQRLFVGRLLDTITKNIFGKIRSDLTAGVSMLGAGGGSGLLDNDGDEEADRDSNEQGQAETNDPTFVDFNKTRASINTRAKSNANNDRKQQQDILIRKNKLLPPEERAKLKLAHHTEPNVFVYMTDRQHLTALLNSLKIYSSQPHYGSLLIIELHYDAANQIHFLRLFTVNSISHNVLPEPVRVNPIACLDSVECSPQQFERNIRHLRLDKLAWQQSCQAASEATGNGGGGSSGGAVPSPSPSIDRVPDSSTTPSVGPHVGTQDDPQGPTERSDTASTPATELQLQNEATASTVTNTTSTTPATIATEAMPDANQTTTSTPNESEIDLDSNDNNKQDEESLLVGPTNTRPISSGRTTETRTEQDENSLLVTAITPTLVEIDKTVTGEPLSLKESSSSSSTETWPA